MEKVKHFEESKTEHLNRNLKGVNINNGPELVKIGLSRLTDKDKEFDILFDEHGNIYSLSGEYAGTYTGKLEDYFKE